MQMNGQVQRSPWSEAAVDTATNTPGKPIKVARFPQSIAITPNGKTAYVASWATTAGRPVGKGPTRSPSRPETVLAHVNRGHS